MSKQSDRPDPASALQLASRLEENHEELCRLVAGAELALHRNRPEAAAVGGQIAATFAWLNHSGIFASAGLETLLRTIGTALPASATSALRTPRSERLRILHVATQLYGTGGHTQMIVRWLDQERATQHRLCLTRQGRRLVPAKVVRSLGGGAHLKLLDSQRGGLLERAVALRNEAQWADVVILHVHPNDVVPAIAFAGRTVPVIYVNHADHVFWTGVGISTLVLSLRGSGNSLNIDRRGVDPRRTAVMVRPLGDRQRVLTRDEAKRRLQLDPNDLLIVTAADGSKYEPITRPSFLDLILPVLGANARVHLHAAGPRPTGEWKQAEEATGGRVRGLGQIDDVSLLHQAADVCIDSFPFSSLTSLLEAASYGVPVMTYRGHPAEAQVLGADSPGLDSEMVAADDPATFRDQLTRLLDDHEYRRSMGERTRTDVESTHDPEGWSATLATIYETAASLDGRVDIGVPIRGSGAVDLLVEHVQARTGFSNGRAGAVRLNVGLLPAKERSQVWVEALLARQRLSPLSLLPDWVSARTRRYSRSGEVPSAS